MTNLTRTFVKGRMNKVIDERLVPNGEYIDAMNVRMGSTEQSEIGVIENSKGNLALTTLSFNGDNLSSDARCIGAIEDSARETIYWFVHDPNFTPSNTTKIDMIVSFNTLTNVLTYHVISTDDGTNFATTLNFNPQYLITGVDIIGDLLFFTDDYNQPRFINIKRNYPAPVGYIDQFSAESILVIKKPPIESPAVVPTQTTGQENYMDTRFISFAYRYRYADGEYSATSQWSDISFIPGPFNFSPDSYLNSGMENTCNSAQVTYNSGGPLVVGIDLLFKQADDNIIKIIEKLDKSNLGLVDNTNYTYTFINSKIFTVLPEAELLRLYDNVPRLAKAQTIMGNRLMYGNYVEGYDLIDKDGSPLKLEYYTDLISEPIGIESVYKYFTAADYTVDGLVNVPDSVLNFDLAGIALVQGSSLNISFTFEHNSFSGTAPFPTQVTQDVSVLFSIFLQNTYADAYSLATSSEFQDVIGTIANIKPVYSPIPGADTSCDGFKLTDRVNCLIPNDLTTPNIPGLVIKYESGVLALNQPISILAAPASTTIGLQLVAMKFVDDVTTPTQSVFEYYKFKSATVSFQKVATPRSLHSNRGYEIGIVYMDEFNRATTALVSPNNTEYVPCSYSGNQNSIQVTIPPSQVAPAWAKRYKFVCKADLAGYDTIYSSFSFKDPNSNNTYFLLEGENTRKVNAGDTLIVKADTTGIATDCVDVIVLEKEAKTAGFISGAPQGVYMKIAANNFSTTQPANSIINPGQNTMSQSSNFGVSVNQPMNIPDPLTPGMFIDYDVPVGSVIQLEYSISREGFDPVVGQGCPKRKYTLSKTYTSTATYANMFDWFVNDGIAATMSTGTSDLDPGEPAWSFYNNQAYSGGQPDGFTGPVSFCTEIQFAFYRDIATNALTFFIIGGCGCGSNKSEGTSIGKLQIIVYRRGLYPIIFETVPTETLPDVFYENNLSFDIDVNGNHMGNVQNQDISLGVPAIVNTGFFNCFTFGNGAESYKINDSIVGKTFNLGERVTSVSAQDYKEANRFSDITYSGVYNPESNLNKLNEFNLGLLNYKYLEVSFGEIMILDGRETDVLVLQEDKISYVLEGKNLLSDSAAGGAITSVPEVLGTQIARVEKYGISFNPESYVQWGYDRFFTDAKRGAVLQLKGNSYSSDQLIVISEMNMRTWFRDMFNDSFNTQKLGGFDPYMNEYVLSTNDIDLPSTPECIECGTIRTMTLSTNEKEDSFDYCVNLGQAVGQVTVSWEVVSISEDGVFNILSEYNTNTYQSGNTTISGSFTFDKDVISVDSTNITIVYTGDIVLNVIVSCPIPEVVKVIEVVVTNNYEAGQTIHTEYRYVDGMYTSPLQSALTTFVSGVDNPLVSRYNVSIGNAGTGAFPTGGSTLTMRTNKIVPDNYVFDPLTDKFRYHRTNTLYNNTPVDIQTLIGLSSVATPITGGPNIYQASFTVPTNAFGDTIYLIWDLRDSVPVQLCYDETNSGSVCCECNPCFTDCITYTISNPEPNTQTAVINFPEGDCRAPFPEPYQVVVAVGEIVEVCIHYSGIVGNYQILEGSPIIEATQCGCDCTETCWEWRVFNVVGSAVVRYVKCITNLLIEETVVEGEELYLCAQINTTPVIVAGEGEIEVSQVCGCGT